MSMQQPNVYVSLSVHTVGSIFLDGKYGLAVQGAAFYAAMPTVERSAAQGE